MQPYIGITGFSSKQQTIDLLNEIPEDSSHRFMCGALVDNKWLCDDDKSILKPYHMFDDTDGIFIDDDRCLNIIHYNLPIINNWHIDRMRQATEIGGKYCDGLQLNGGIWPYQKTLEQYKTFYPDYRIILQINHDLLAQYKPNQIGECAQITRIM